MPLIDEPGVYDAVTLPFVPALDYHACRTRISRGQLWTLHSKSPAHLKAELAEPKPPTAAMLRGSALHTAVLEPERFDREYALPPLEVLDSDRRTKDGRARFEAWLEAAKTEHRFPLGWDPVSGVFDRAGVRMVIEVARQLTADKQLARLFRDGDGMTEATYCWDEDRAKYRVRFDRLNKTKRGWVAIDLKGSADARLKGFQGQLVSHGLHFQAGMYADGFAACRDGDELRSFVFVVYETEPPYSHAFFRCAEDVLDCGKLEYRQAAGLLRQCILDDDWPGYETLGIQTLNMPGWYK